MTIALNLFLVGFAQRVSYTCSYNRNPYTFTIGDLDMHCMVSTCILTLFICILLYTLYQGFTFNVDAADEVVEGNETLQSCGREEALGGELHTLCRCKYLLTQRLCHLKRKKSCEKIFNSLLSLNWAVLG